jgi:hypothetical protein
MKNSAPRHSDASSGSKTGRPIPDIFRMNASGSGAATPMVVQVSFLVSNPARVHPASSRSCSGALIHLWRSAQPAKNASGD